MPKYVLNTKGKIVERDKPDFVKDATELAGEYTGKAGSYHEDKIGGIFSNVNLPATTFATSLINSGNDEKKHTIGSVTPSFTTTPDGEKDIFPERKDNNFLINPSFGADEPVKFHKNFNDYLNNKGGPFEGQNAIFADELEMIAGLEFNSFGATDFSRILFVFDYIFEAIAYIAVIEGILAAEEALGDTSETIVNYNLTHDHKFELGNSGPVSYNVLSRFIREVLQYPADKRSKVASINKNLISERVGAFIVGLSLYVNTDPKLFLKKIQGTSSLNSNIENFAKGNKLSVFEELAYYLTESILSLSKIGQNRLFMLIRRFHQKADWHKNVLYKAKSKSPENFVDKFIVELNYYYVKFIIERMHIGLKLKKSLTKKYKKFKRSGRIKDSSGLAYIQEIGNNQIIIRDLSIDNPDYESEKQSMSIDVLPQAFILPKSIKNSYRINHKEGKRLGYFCDERVRSYFLNTKEKQKRLSPEVVVKMEEYYEKEMMPFYFQDLRTNEIIGFHAFIDSITDNFNPNYNPTKGFGRIDAVQHYTDTTRNVNITFTLAAMSKEDHDLMWYQINKIVSMCYPQWSDGFKKKTKEGDNVSSDEFGKVFPFTQVPTASPLIRIRLGDVIKSNYTKHAIEKLHGSGNALEYEPLADALVNIESSDLVLNIGSYNINEENMFQINSEVLQELEIEVYQAVPCQYEPIGTSDLPHYHKTGYKIYSKDNIKNSDKYLVRFKDKNMNLLLIDNLANDISDTNYLIVSGSDIKEVKGEQLKVLSINEDQIERNLKKFQSHQKAFKDYTKAYDENGNVNNPVTAAYETTLGKGLAGFITMLDVNYNDQLWETEVVGSKAPKLVKLTINFAPIHDIPPGLDADGAMRAPVYNAGGIINRMYGNVYDKDEVKNRD